VRAGCQKLSDVVGRGDWQFVAGRQGYRSGHMADMESSVRVTRRGTVGELCMARPAKRNAFDVEMVGALADGLAALGGDDAVRVVVLSGEGAVFSAGADLGYMRAMGAAGHAENVADAERLAGLFAAIRDCPKPVVARVQGAAMGGGIGLVAACDLAVAAANTRFAFGEVRLGLAPAVIAPFVVPRIGLAAARDLFLTGETFDAARALAIGLVARVVPEGELDDAVADRVAALGAGGPKAQAAIKRLLPVVAAGGPDVTRFGAGVIAERRASVEGREGLAAFLERRRPWWAAAGSVGAAKGNVGTGEGRSRTDRDRRAPSPDGQSASGGGA
jgi:methylglutaconyl-CoA hydratase